MNMPESAVTKLTKQAETLTLPEYIEFYVINIPQYEQWMPSNSLWHCMLAQIPFSQMMSDYSG
jgi:hypothetical protein